MAGAFFRPRGRNRRMNRTIRKFVIRGVPRKTFSLRIVKTGNCPHRRSIRGPLANPLTDLTGDRRLPVIDTSNPDDDRDG